MKSLTRLFVTSLIIIFVTACGGGEGSSSGGDSGNETSNNISSFSLTPNDSAVINKDTKDRSYLPELLGSNKITAHYNDGTNEVLDCWGHHYNFEAKEHVLHCSSPSNGADIYLGLSSSDTSVVSFTYGRDSTDTYYMSYWIPNKSGTTQITGTLLFADTSPTFLIYVSISQEIASVFSSLSYDNLSCGSGNLGSSVYLKNAHSSRGISTTVQVSTAIKILGNESYTVSAGNSLYIGCTSSMPGQISETYRYKITDAKWN